MVVLGDQTRELERSQVLSIASGEPTKASDGTFPLKDDYRLNFGLGFDF